MFQSFSLHGAAHILVFKVGEKYHGVDIWRKVAVDGGDSLLVFEVFRVANAPDNELRSLASAAIDGHIAIAHHPYSVLSVKVCLNHIYSLIGGEHILFVAVYANGNDHLVKQF